MVRFTRGYEDNDRLKLRLRALEVTRKDLMRVAEKYMMTAVEEEATSRVVFGSQNAKFDALEKEGWNIYNPIDFLSYKYFDKWNADEKKGV